MKPLITLILIITSLLVSPLQSKAVQFTRAFNDRELVTSDYSGFAMDGKGRLWIGTSYGLVCYDGANFDRYTYDEENENSLSDNRIKKILADREGRLWIGTAEGLNLYRPESDDFYRVTLPGMALKGYILDIIQQKNGNILAIASGVGIYIMDFSSGQPEAVRYLPDLLHDRRFNTLCESLDGTLIVGTHDGDIVTMASNGQSKVYKVTDSYFLNLLRDDNGDIIMTTADRVWRWHPGSTVFEPIPICGSPRMPINYATLGVNGDIYIGGATDGHGLLVLKKGAREITQKEDLSNPLINLKRSRVMAVYEDSHANLWLGCPNQGIVMVPADDAPFNFTPVSSYLPGFIAGNTVVAADPAGKMLWLGLDDGRLLRITDNEQLLNSWALPSAVTSLLFSRTGTLYIAVQNHGIYAIPANGSGAPTLVFPTQGLYERPVLAEDSRGNLYLGVRGQGVVRFNPATKESKWLKTPAGKPLGTWVATLMCDSKDRLWCGLFGGLQMLDLNNGDFKSLGDLDPSLVKGVYNSFAESPRGQIWAGSSNGVVIIDPKALTHKRLTIRNGLADNFVGPIAFDDEGNAWVGTNDAVHRIAPNLSVTKYFANGAFSDRNYFSATRDRASGSLIFSGQRGLISFQPKKLRQTKFDRNISIGSIYLNDSKVTPTSTVQGSSRKIIQHLDGDRLRINLSYRDNFLKLKMTTADYRETENVHYEWRIPSLNDGWVSCPTGQSTIILPHLNSGHYTLEVRACDNGAYSSVTEIDIRVSSPWYLSTVAKLFCLLVILALIWLAVSLVRKRNAEMIYEDKIKFFMNISHELRSPITLILSPLESLIKKNSDPDTAKNLNAIHRNASRILGLVNQLLDIRKIDKGKMQITCAETELVSFTRELVEIFAPQAEEKHISLTFSAVPADLTELNVWIDRRNFDKVLVNLITNAIKYTTDGGSIAVEVTRGQNSALGPYAQISVADTGIGLDEKSIPHLFERFYQGKVNGAANIPIGFGVGLDLCRLLVSLHHGTISAENRRDTRGSRFTVRIPLGNSHFAPEQLTDSAPTADGGRLVLPSIQTDTPRPAKRVRKNRTQHILIVDDDPEIRDYVRDTLAPLGRISTAANGEEALQKIMQQPVHLVISDVVMPGMDGLTLLKTLKANVETNHIPVIMLSSKNDIDDRVAGWGKGADGFIGKPFNVDELLAIVENMLDNRLLLRGKFSGSQQQESKISTPDIRGNDTVLLDKIVAIIDKNLEAPDLTVEMLGNEVGLSRAHLNRKMKELVGLSPSDFIRNMRLRKASELLSKPDIDISQIAYSVGFSSQSHFSTAFKRFTGVSPTDFRHNLLKQKAAEQKATDDTSAHDESPDPTTGPSPDTEE